jgi:hypothetical protein
MEKPVIELREHLLREKWFDEANGRVIVEWLVAAETHFWKPNDKLAAAKAFNETNSNEYRKAAGKHRPTSPTGSQNAALGP